MSRLAVLPAVAPSSAASPAPRIVAVVNLKGGVGKTTVTLNLGAAWAALGLRVLLVDLDPTATLTRTLRADPTGENARSQTIQRFLLGEVEEPLERVVRPVDFGLEIVPASRHLYEVPYQIRNNPLWGLALARTLTGVSGYDAILLDCPPDGDTFTALALGAATDALLVLQAEPAAAWCAGSLANQVRWTQRNVNPGLRRQRVVVNMVSPRLELNRQMLEVLRDSFPGQVCRTTIPRTIRIAESTAVFRPVLDHEPQGAAAKAFRSLAAELLVEEGAA